MAAAPSAAVEHSDTKQKQKAKPSGRLLLRMPAELHAELARAAERQGVSLNGFITSALAAKVGRGDPAEEPVGGSDRTRLVVGALIANAIVIGLAAAAAIAILVLAWRG